MLRKCSTALLCSSTSESSDGGLNNSNHGAAGHNANSNANSGSSGARQQRKVPLTAVHQIVTELVAAAVGKAPTVVVIEDVHFLDAMSWKLLLQLTKCKAPLLLVATAIAPGDSADSSSTASEGAARWWPHYTRLIKQRITSHFSLAAFTLDEVRHLCAVSLQGAGITVTPALVNTVWSLSGGNPYWCVELVRYIQVRPFANHLPTVVDCC
jgi:hypothetical protein